MDNIYKPIDIDKCSDQEMKYLIKVSALIGYYLQICGMKVLEWRRSKKLRCNKPYYHSRGLSDFDKFKILYNSPAPFSIQNVYFDLEGLKRITLDTRS